MEELTVIKLSDIEEKLKSLQAAEALPGQKSSLKEEIVNSPFIQAAAVLVFYDPETINPIVNSFESNERKRLITELIGYSEIVLSYGNGYVSASASDTGNSHSKINQRLSYFLKDDIRKLTLSKLVAKGMIQNALNANVKESFSKDVLLQYIFTQCLLGNTMNFERMNIQELNALQRVSEWLEKGIPSLSKIMIERQIEMTEMLTTFRHLTGRYENGEFEEQFRGRKNELASLRKYVGVAPPQGTLESIHRYYEQYIEPVFNWDRKPPLLIFGLGGVGKSTLLAKFILDHAEAQEQDRFPFVYLDFDRAGLSVLEPETLLTESSRQLSIQYADETEIGDSFSDFYNRWKNRQFISSDEKNTESIVITSDKTSRRIRQDRDEMLAQFIKLIKRLAALEKKPFLMVIDTFEEVQYKGQESVKQLYDFMLQLQRQYPLLRVVVAGRAPVSGIKTQQMELGDLDSEAAIGFLIKSGINDSSLAKTIASKVGGNPLTLKLSAELVKEFGKDELNQITLSKKKTFFWDDRLPEIQIQGMLYRRILKHIHDPRVVKLANPGLVLREITPDLILKVLANPCNLKISSIEEAENLFSEMSKEVSLVRYVNPTTIRHRPDVRKVMLNLIKEENPSLVEEIQHAAVEYYNKLDGVMARAEEFYHRLCLNESPRSLDNRWIDGIQNYLLNSMDELPPKAQAYLSGRTGIEMNDVSIWESADIEDSERRIVRMAANLLNTGQGEKVLELIKDETEHLTKTGVIPLLKVKALIQLERYSEAEDVISQSLSSYYSDQFDPKIKAEFIRCREKIRIEENPDTDSDIQPNENRFDTDSSETFEYSL